jgi:hypothetical protein
VRFVTTISDTEGAEGSLPPFTSLDFRAERSLTERRPALLLAFRLLAPLRRVDLLPMATPPGFERSLSGPEAQSC